MASALETEMSIDIQRPEGLDGVVVNGETYPSTTLIGALAIELLEMADESRRNYYSARPEVERNNVIEECANMLDAIYSQGPQRGTVVWGQAWGSGVLDAAAALRSLKQPPPQDG